jgi:tRNA1Val (adenine37-N6)-methyltransferase
MSTFRFKAFSIEQSDAVHKVGTDSMLLGAYMEATHPKSILDIGTGTGVLALMCAQRFPEAQIQALEINPLAVSLARKNFLQSPFAERLSVIEKNIFDYTAHTNYDLIVTNPPYFTEDVESGNENRQLARNASAMPFDQLLEKVKEILDLEGQFYCVLPYSRKAEIESLVKTAELYITRKITLNGTPEKPVRLIYSIQRQPQNLEEEMITIRDNSGSYTEEYIQLTEDFHAFRPR